MTDTDEEQVVLRLLPFTVNGQTCQVPELKWRANRDWKALLKATFARLALVSPDTLEGLDTMLDAERELILAYDVSHALGDLEDATETEIDAIYNGLVKVAFPLASSPTAVGLMIVRTAIASAQANSMSG